MFLAHIKTDEQGNTVEQSLNDHLLNSAKYSSESIQRIGLENTGYLAGILHDMGKYTSAFQDYISGTSTAGRGDIIHTFQGCRYILEHYKSTTDPYEDVSAELLAYAVGAHHGQFDCVGENKKLGLKYRCEKENTGYHEAVQAYHKDCISETNINSLFVKSANELKPLLESIITKCPDDSELSFELGLLARLLLSAVIEGDRRDTAEFMNCSVFSEHSPDMKQIWAGRLAHAESKMAAFDNTSPVDKARTAISKICRQAAESPGGIYKLNVPTGGGKTLSSLRFALAHAMQNNSRHIIFTSPLLSILEQNAAVLRKFIGDDSLILEHHSNVVKDKLSPEKLSENELLMETWDSPIIITTLVQLLNTLFSGKTSSVRRFHSLANSIIVIDEVQTVPIKMISMFDVAIRFLSEQLGSTVVLCSATQPYFEGASHPITSAGNSIPDIVPYTKDIWDVFKRTEIVPGADVRTDDIEDFVDEILQETNSLLIVCNTKKEAADLAGKLNTGGANVFHLSAGMCIQHRRDVLSRLKASLADGKKTVCVSTQVIEAGVDISFECVIRLAAGMDSVVQAAGRCNRNGERDAPCPVYVINCPDEKLGMLTDIKRGKAATIQLLNNYSKYPQRYNGSLTDDKSITEYYKTLYASLPVGAQDYPGEKHGIMLYDLLSENTAFADSECDGIELYQLRQAFKTAGDSFEVFDEDTASVIVPYCNGKQIIAELLSSAAEHSISYRKKLIEQASIYSVSVYSGQRKRLDAEGAIYSVYDGSILILNEEYYDETVGVINEPHGNTYKEV